MASQISRSKRAAAEQVVGRKIDAERWLATQKALMGRGDWVDPKRSRILFADAAELWVQTLIRVKPKTAHQYRHLLGRWVLPTWGKVQLGRITVEGIERWVADMTAAGLGHSGSRQALLVLSSVLDASVRAHRIASNPARLVRVRRSKPAERVFLTHREVDALARTCGGSGDFVRLLAYTGLRVGEATALRVRDIDFDRLRISVVRTFSDVGGQLVEESPKTHQHRSVPIVPLLEARSACPC
ncbi:MAG TPA: site-specific integrase [Actinomycetes bacterium]|nr:site-specific integrase [Actinomycetes bacterium]